MSRGTKNVSDLRARCRFPPAVNQPGNILLICPQVARLQSFMTLSFSVYIFSMRGSSAFGAAPTSLVPAFAKTLYKLSHRTLAGGLSPSGSLDCRETLFSREAWNNFQRRAPKPLLYFSSMGGGLGAHRPKDNKQCCLLKIQSGCRSTEMV